MPTKKIWLKHYHYDIFQPFEITEKGIDTTDKNDLRFNFHAGDAGEIETIYIKFEPTVDPLDFSRQPALVDMDKEKLNSYTGEFKIGEIIAKVYTKNDQTLYLFVPGQPEYELIPTGPDKFSIKKLEGYSIEFVEDKNENITGVLFIQPNGTFQATKSK